MVDAVEASPCYLVAMLNCAAGKSWLLSGVMSICRSGSSAFSGPTGHVTTTKGGRLRYVPLTVRLLAALKNHPHLKGGRVVCSEDGTPLTQRLVQGVVARAARRANLSNVGVHVLRHTFCSHPRPSADPTVHRTSNHHAATAVRLSDVDASGDALSAPIHHEQQRHRRSEWAGVSWPKDDDAERDAAGGIGVALVRRTSDAAPMVRTSHFVRSFVPWRGKRHGSASSWN